MKFWWGLLLFSSFAIAEHDSASSQDFSETHGTVSQNLNQIEGDLEKIDPTVLGELREALSEIAAGGEPTGRGADYAKFLLDRLSGGTGEPKEKTEEPKISSPPAKPVEESSSPQTQAIQKSENPEVYRLLEQLSPPITNTGGARPPILSDNLFSNAQVPVEESGPQGKRGVKRENKNMGYGQGTGSDWVKVSGNNSEAGASNSPAFVDASGRKTLARSIASLLEKREGVFGTWDGVLSDSPTFEKKSEALVNASPSYREFRKLALRAGIGSQGSVVTYYVVLSIAWLSTIALFGYGLIQIPWIRKRIHR